MRDQSRLGVWIHLCWICLLRGCWCRLMILWWNIPAVRPSNGRHIVRVSQTCFSWISHLFFALYVDGPALVSIRAVRAALFSFSWVFRFYRFVSDFSPHASAGLCGSLRLGLLGSRSDNWFCPPLNAVLLNCISSFVRPVRGGLLDGHMFTHFKSVCMFALASLYIFTFFWPIGDHFCSLWSNLKSFFQWKPMLIWGKHDGWYCQYRNFLMLKYYPICVNTEAPWNIVNVGNIMSNFWQKIAEFEL